MNARIRSIADAVPHGPEAAAAALTEAGPSAPEHLALDEAVRRSFWTRRDPHPDVAGGPIGWACLLTCHPNGRVREAALLRLARERDAIALPFVLVRLTDWVEEVRRAAAGALDALVAPERSDPDLASVNPLELGDSLVAALPLVQQLRARVRAGVAFDRVDELVRRPEVRRSLHRALGAWWDPRARLEAVRVLAEVDPAGDWRARALGDVDVAVRVRAAEGIPPQATDLLDRAWRDKAAAVRRRALVHLAAAPGAEAVLEGALLDPSLSIRAEARFLLSRRSPRDFAAFYRQAVERTRGKALRTAILGLSECGERADADLVAPWLAADDPALCRAAVRAVGRLDPSAYAGDLYALLAHDTRGVSRDARSALAARGVAVSRDALLALVLDSALPIHARRHALSLAWKCGAWAQLPLLLQGLEVADLEQDATRGLNRWFARRNRVFVRPTSLDRAELKAVHDQARSPAVARFAARLLALAQR